jgi:hypothetical protein
MENKNESLDFSFDESNININYKEQTKYLFGFIKRYIGKYIKGIVATICSAFFFGDNSNLCEKRHRSS